MRSYFSQVNIPKMYSGVKFFDSQHERMIAISRLYLVKNNISDGYLAEREIVSEMIAQNQTIKRRFLPDAIFYDKNGNKVILEYELAVKTRKQFLGKLRYHQAHSFEKPGDSCLFIVKNNGVLNYLKSLNLKNIEIVNSCVIETWYKELLHMRRPTRVDK